MNRTARFLSAFALLTLASLSVAQERVYVFEIKAEIDPRSNRYVQLALAEAEDWQADRVLIEMDTYGGAVNDADDIRQALLDFDKPVTVFINKNAASAGALISIACDRIYMNEGANIGAATVVNGGDGSKAPDKYQSYMRGMMRATAERTGRDPRIAEAMVDESLVVEGVSVAGQVVTFTPAEAIDHGFCDGMASSVEEVLRAEGVADYQISRFELPFTESVISFFLNPAISGVLLLVIVGGIYFELQTPGVGFPILATVVAGVLYLVPYYLNGLADNWELILLVVGVGLLLAEAFLIPGFGLAGVSGIFLTAGSLFLMMIDNDGLSFEYVDPSRMSQALLSVGAGLTGGLFVIFYGLSKLNSSPLFKRIALQDTMKREAGYTSSFIKKDMVGKKGAAYTVLRPSGKVIVEGELYDASTRGDFIDRETPIVVVSQEGTSLKVKEDA